jgi:hypothetical protein
VIVDRRSFDDVCGRWPRLRRSLREAVAWCGARAFLDDGPWREHPLRSPALRDVAREHHAVYSDFGIVEEVVIERHNLLICAGRRAAEGADAGARVLGFYVDDTLSEGATEAASNGWFDSDDLSPWDTWIGGVTLPGPRRLLLSWVPAAWVDRVAAGTQVSSTDCIAFLDDLL